jgi:hypothetical protein
MSEERRRTRWEGGPGIPPENRVYATPCARPDGCRIASLSFAPTWDHSTSLLTADCGWTTRIPIGDEHHLPEAIDRWKRHECLVEEAS